MAPSGTALSLQGSYDIEATGCGLYVNSPDTNALKIIGNGGTLNAKFLDVVGGLDIDPRHQPYRAHPAHRTEKESLGQFDRADPDQRRLHDPGSVHYIDHRAGCGTGPEQRHLLHQGRNDQRRDYGCGYLHV
jgi:hypothetical protein